MRHGFRDAGFVIGYGSYLALTRDGGMSAGNLTRFLGYLGIMYGPLQRFAELNIVYQTSLAALERVALVGPSGPGKSTVVSLLPPL
jgi:subfamily B ATP-binding cassette protein MsbA